MGEFEILGLRLKELRKLLNMTQKEFADHVGISTATLSAYETGAKNPSVGVFKTISSKCSVSIDWLCGIEHKNGVSTCADIIRFLSALQEIGLLNIEERLDHDNPFFLGNGDDDVDFPRYYSLHIQHPEIDTFLGNWAKMIKLRHDKTIDDDLYSLWMEDYARKLEMVKLIEKK